MNVKEVLEKIKSILLLSEELPSDEIVDKPSDDVNSENLEEKIKELDEKISILEEKIKELTSTIENNNNEIENLTNNLKEKDEKIENLSKLNNEKDVKIEELTKEVEKLNLELSTTPQTTPLKIEKDKKQSFSSIMCEKIKKVRQSKGLEY